MNNKIFIKIIIFAVSGLSAATFLAGCSKAKLLNAAINLGFNAQPSPAPSPISLAGYTFSPPMSYSGGIVSLSNLSVTDGGSGTTSFGTYTPIIYHSTPSATFAAISLGSSGQVLVSTGASSDPSFQTITTPSWTVSSQTSNFTVTTSQQGTFFTCSGSTTATLPLAATVGKGFQLLFQKTDSGPSPSITIAPSGADTVDGSPTLTLSTQYAVAWIVSDGVATWQVIQ